jgi:NADPH oxidase
MLPVSYYFDKIFWGAIWIAANIAVFAWAFYEEKHRKDNQKNKDVMGIYLLIARSAARCLNLQLALILIPICKNFLSFLKRVPYLHKLIPLDKNIKFHRYIAVFLFVFTLIHTIAHWFNAFKLEKKQNSKYDATQIAWISWAGATGQIMVFIMILMYTAAMTPLKKQCYELFWYTHHLSMPFFGCALFHSFGCLLKNDNGVCYEKTTWKWVIGPLSLYFFEILLRHYRAAQKTKVVKVVHHPNKTFELQFSKPSMKMRCGQYVFVNVPKVSRTQWHPYTLTSCQDDDFHAIHLRVVGDWTMEVAKKFGCMTENGDWQPQYNFSIKDIPHIKVDGPYGSACEHVFKYKSVVFACGGIGVTPFAAILKRIWYSLKNREQDRKIQKLTILWVSRSMKSFEWFQDLLYYVEEENVDNFLDIHIHLTGEIAQKQALQIVSGSSSVRDSITNLKSKTQFGRPDLGALFKKIKYDRSSLEFGKVGVFVCGPQKFSHAVRQEVHRASDSEVQFDFHKEIF